MKLPAIKVVNFKKPIKNYNNPIMQHADPSLALSSYQKHILDSIIADIHADEAFSILGLVQAAISQKNILPSMNVLVMETSYALKEFLQAHQFVTEQAEMTVYFLTPKGLILKACGSVGEFERRNQRHKLSLFQKLFINTEKDLKIDSV